MNGILNLDKPSGITSHDCVARIRRALRQKRIGHAGTLDPMATGVLLLCLGQATRLSDLLMGGRKAYRAEITFGVTTHSQDATGEVLTTRDASGLTREALEAVLPRFTGDLQQVPPMVSAVHHQGQRLYYLARKGIEVEREPRTITIYDLRLLSFTPGGSPRAEIEVTCSAGAYIRTLAHDIGEALGCGAHLSALRRVAVGPFRVEEAVSLEEAEEAARTGVLESRLLPMSAALKDHPTAATGAEDIPLLMQGRSLPSPFGQEDRDLVGLIGPGGDLVALARAREGRLFPFKVLLGP
jgi:tRNA pseudouridine55 synthase